MPPSTFILTKGAPRSLAIASATCSEEPAYIERLIARSLEDGAGDVVLGRVLGEADQHTAGIRAPVRRKEARERGYKVHA